jgi:hypothetical protein
MGCSFSSDSYPMNLSTGHYDIASKHATRFVDRYKTVVPVCQIRYLVRGIILDNVSRVGAVTAAKESLSTDVVEFFWESTILLNETDSPYPTGEDVVDVRWRLLLCDSTPGCHTRASGDLLQAVNVIMIGHAIELMGRNGSEEALHFITQLMGWWL